MDETRKGQTGSGVAQGSGSDTVSAAKIAGGTGAGATGQSAQPGGGSGSLGTGAQSATLASHTSRPLGGTAQSGSQQGSGSGSGQGGVTDTARQAAQAAASTARDAAEQVQNQAGQAYEQATNLARDTADWASDAYESGSRQLSELGRRSLQTGRESGQTVQRFVSENPVLVGIVGLAAGLLLGALLPRSRQEDRTFGRWADEVRDQGWRYARDMTQRGREYVEQAFGDEESDFDSPGRDRQRDDQRRSGPSGRYQNH
jgi:ElaB/YqjD/DUF883 family membrane-anchored ribosome-binding protein